MGGDQLRWGQTCPKTPAFQNFIAAEAAAAAQRDHKLRHFNALTKTHLFLLFAEKFGKGKNKLMKFKPHRLGIRNSLNPSDTLFLECVSKQVSSPVGLPNALAIIDSH